MGRIRKYFVLLGLMFSVPLHSSSIEQTDPVAAAVAQAAQALMQLGGQPAQADNLIGQNLAQAQTQSAKVAAGKHRCEECGKSFSRPSHLRNHERTHTGEKPYSCEQCGKSFTQSSSLREHEKTHTGEKPFACEICGKSFTSSSNLKTHERTHTGEKLYVCEQCGKRFATAVSLRAHQRNHIDKEASCKNQVDPEKNISKENECKHCGLCCQTRSALEIHERIHTGEKPYSCTYCGKSFTQSSALRRHERTHTSEKPFVCGVCNKAFNDQSSLRRHQRARRSPCTPGAAGSADQNQADEQENADAIYSDSYSSDIADQEEDDLVDGEDLD